MIKNFLYIIIALLIFAGCSKSSDNKSTQPTSAIIGKWMMSADSITEYTNGVRVSYFANDFIPGSYRLFNSDGTGVDYSPADANGPEFNVNLTWSVSGNKVSFNYPAYTYDGDHEDARTDVYTILNLSSNKLGIEYSSSFSSAGSSSTVNQYYYFTK